ncbi:hypothetical protein [Hyphococcus sp.]|uniref:hypothetical protein n=1 Tax=Hyphococcus sp. TaxID=2038636 RepID=UPI0035C6AA42
MRAFLIIFLLVASPHAAAQGLSPMKGEIRTYSHQFAVLLTASNPYNTAQRFSVALRDEWGEPAQRVQATVPNFSLPPGESGAFYVWGDVPPSKRILVCVTSQFFATGAGAPVRGEVCGKFDIVQLTQQ